MRKHIIMIIISIVLSSCSIVPIWNIAKLRENPFESAIDLSREGHIIGQNVKDGALEVENIPISLTPGSLISIPLITDVHVGRSDSGVEELDYEAFLSFLEKGDYPFLINLGDLVDQGRLDNSEIIRFYSLVANKVNGNHIYVIGNHELHDESPERFDTLLSAMHPGKETARMARYTFGPLSIYKLDNSLGAFGKEQLEYLEETLRKDESKYKIFIAHVNVATGRTGDHSFVITGMSDQREVHRIMRLMDEYGVSLLLTGHHHKGNIEYHYTESAGEFNAASFHRRDTLTNFESKGYFYILEIDTLKNEIRIVQYMSQSAQKTGEVFTFPLS